jgi:hypothetical protein
MNLLLIISLILCVVCLNILWYIIKDILSKNGYRVHYFYDHLSDIYNLSNLIKNELNFELRKKYSLVKRIWIFLAVLFFVILASLFVRFEIFRLFTI